MLEGAFDRDAVDLCFLLENSWREVVMMMLFVVVAQRHAVVRSLVVVPLFIEKGEDTKMGPPNLVAWSGLPHDADPKAITQKGKPKPSHSQQTTLSCREGERKPNQTSSSPWKSLLARR